MDSAELSSKEINEPYYFESDHVALKENADYRNLLHTLAILEAQRQQAAQDIEVLYKAQDDAMADPVQFVENLQSGKDLDLPKPQKVVPLPEIQWEKYTSSANFSSFGLSRHMTRNKKNAVETVDRMQSLKSKLIQGLSASGSSTNNSVDPSGSDSEVVVVRGRARDSSKPATFNQLWTEEEQQRLETLLIQFPPEEIESRRWAKIADALGNRTPMQVASRVQKYFVRLAKEGLPVPGRMPNLAALTKKNIKNGPPAVSKIYHCCRFRPLEGSHRHHRYNRLYYPNSTFMQSHIPPVWMADDAEDSSGFSGLGLNVRDTPIMPESASIKGESSEEDENYPEEILNSPEYQELMRLKKMKEKIVQEQSGVTRHIGYKCDNCGCEPIVGTRWHCRDCPSDLSFDFCDDCSNVSFQQGKHNSSHRLQPYKRAVLDSDYMSYTKADYNYLDPNYMPAS